MASEKTKVIEYLFTKYWNKSTGSLTKRMMSLTDVAQAIRDCKKAYGLKLSDRNPANFMKDILRRTNASEYWPESVAKKRFTAEQRTGDGECFEFVRYRSGQNEPFPYEYGVREDAPRYAIQSISVPLVTKTLGRSDESWLIQTAVNLRVVETHFAIAAEFPLLELTLLQMGIKLRSTEIDALFLGKAGDAEQPETVLVTCEAKQTRDRLIPSQIMNQVRAAFNEANVQVVVPIALQAIKGIGFYLTEFDSVKRQNAEKLKELSQATDAIYEVHPPVKGI